MFWKVVRLVFKARDAPSYQAADFIAHIDRDAKVPNIPTTNSIGEKSCPEGCKYIGAKVISVRESLK